VALGLSRPVSDYWKAFYYSIRASVSEINQSNSVVRIPETLYPASKKCLLFTRKFQSPFGNENAATRQPQSDDWTLSRIRSVGYKAVASWRPLMEDARAMTA